MAQLEGVAVVVVVSGGGEPGMELIAVAVSVAVVIGGGADVVDEGSEVLVGGVLVGGVLVGGSEAGADATSRRRDEP